MHNKFTDIKQKTLSFLIKDFLSHFLTIVLIPLLVPTYLFAIILFYYPEAMPVAFTEKEKWIAVLYIFAFTTILPFIVVFILYKLKVISTLDLEKREDRLIPQLFSLLCYISITIFLINKYSATNALSLTMVANTVSVLFILVITQFWKISTHSSGALGFLTILYFLLHKFPATHFNTPFIVITIMVIGVCLARLHLKVHTLGQVICGCLLGITIGTSVFYFL